MNFKLTTDLVKEIKADIEVIIISNNYKEHRFVKDKELLEKSGFKSTQDETCLLIEKDRLYVGIENISSINVRTAVASAIRVLVGKSYKSIKIASYMNHPKCTAVLRAMVEGFILGAYSFDRYKSKKSELSIAEITISMEEYNEYQLDIESCEKAMENAEIVANATNFTRDIVNTTPDDCYPKVMAQIAKEMVTENGLECIIVKPKELEKEKMNTLLAVARASRHKPRVIHLAHKPQNPKQ